jgi:tellurite resistance protein
MQKQKRTVLLILSASIILAALSLMAMQSQGQNKDKKAKKVAVLRKQGQALDAPTAQEANQASEMPVADFSAPEPADPAKRARRQSKGARYNKRLPAPVSDIDGEGGAVLFNHWWEGVPAIPAALSDAVVIGEVTDARSYLANDKAGVYSEFTIRIEEVLKSTGGSNPLSVGSSIVADRDGGAVRFPSGRIKKYVTSGKGMARTGGRYVLFLKLRDGVDDYGLITGYELRGATVVPIDGTGNKEGSGRLAFDRYIGADAASFLSEVRAALTQSSGGRD